MFTVTEAVENLRKADKAFAAARQRYLSLRQQTQAALEAKDLATEAVEAAEALLKDIARGNIAEVQQER